jgi:hypothetical protein
VNLSWVESCMWLVKGSLCSEVLLKMVFNHLFDPKCASFTPLAGVSRPPNLDDTEWRDSRGHNIEARTGGNSLHACYFFLSLVSSNL